MANNNNNKNIKRTKIISERQKYSIGKPFCVLIQSLLFVCFLFFMSDAAFRKMTKQFFDRNNEEHDEEFGDILI